MKSFQTSMACAVAFLVITGARQTTAAPTPTSAATSNEVWSVVERFVKEKHALAEDLAKKHQLKMPSQAEEFFAAVRNRDWTTSSNLFYAMQVGAGKRMQTNTTPEKKWMPIELWDPVLDTYGAYELFHGMNPKFVRMFGADIVKDIPAGSIYFGGNDPGLFLVSAFSESQSEGRPFFIISQNRLTDPGYVLYVADMFGNKISFFGTNDMQAAVQSYMADWQQRSLHDKNFPNEPRQTKPGEDYHPDEAGKVQIYSHVSEMAINGHLAKTVFEINPTKEFYLSESFPLSWMFPHLTPSGVVMKVNRADVPELTEDILKRDHEFWARYSGQLVGNWITYDTSVKEVAAFVEKVFLIHDYSGFQGDVDFIHDEVAQKAFSKMRSSIAGVYCWRLGMPPDGGTTPAESIAKGDNRKLIEREADFAFKQAWAFCPKSPEAIYRYVQLLVNMGRVDDALLIAETGKKVDPENTQLGYLIQNLKSIRGQRGAGGNVQNENALLEKAVDANPTNITQQFELAQKYVQAGQNEKAYKVLDRVMAFSDLTVPEVTAVADAFNQLNQPARLAAALERLTELKPESPELWYDLAAVRAGLGQTQPALEALKKALDLNAKRLAEDSKAKDVRASLSGDPRFSKLREMAEFKAIVGK